MATAESTASADVSPSVLIAVCTFRRNAELSQLLDSLLPALAGHRADVVIVDNDADGGAKPVVTAHPLGVRYHVCTEPGIAQARNASLEFRHGYDFVAFIDDDETVAQNWLTELLLAVSRYGADVATGPVVTSYPEHTAAWVVRGQFLQRARHSSGTRLPRFATNNALVRVAAIDALELPRFDTAFSRSGGSDTELAWRLHRAGSNIVWMDTAEVFEALPDERLTGRMVMRRLTRGGNNSGRLINRERSRFYVVLRGIATIGYGLALTVRSLMLGRGFRAVDFEYVPHGAGMINSAFGVITREYSRG